MAIAYVQSTNVNTGAPASSLSATLAGVGLADLLIAVVQMYNSGTATVSLADGVNAWAQIGGYFNPAAPQRLSLWYAKNSASGNTTLTATPSQSEYLAITMLEYSGADTVSPFDSTAGNTGSSTAPDSGSCAVSNANSLLFSCGGNGTNSTSIWTPGSGFTGRNVNNTAILPIACEDKILSAAADGVWSMNSSIAWACIAASFKPATGPTFNPAWARGANRGVGCDHAA